MKKLMKLMVVATIILFSTNTFAEELGLKMSNLTSYAAPKKSSKSSGEKAFEGKGSKTLSIGLGMSSYLGNFGSGGFYRYGGYSYGGYAYGFWYSGTLSIQAEFGIHDYVGLGLVTGIGGRNYRGGGGILYVPVGIMANFHFFQLIEDKTSKDIHGDKIDLYAGLNVGSGLAVSFPASSSTIGGMLFVGPQFGIKYYPKPKFGIYAEVGYGKSLLEAGISLKL
ncbi:MAG TPA: hypothetical protein PK431_11985 [Chitinophagales bacterium]|nr:hypothetical protein [Chitinophagales bacterium]